MDGQKSAGGERTVRDQGKRTVDRAIASSIDQVPRWRVGLVVPSLACRRWLVPRWRVGLVDTTLLSARFG